MAIDEDEIKKLILKSLGAGAAGQFGVLKIDANDLIGDSKEPPFAQAERLRNLYALWSQRTEFVPGDLIQVKSERMTYWKRAKEKDVLIVLEILPKPVYGYELEGDNADPSNIYAMMRYDITAAFVGNDGDMVPHLYDSRFFKKFQA